MWASAFLWSGNIRAKFVFAASALTFEAENVIILQSFLWGCYTLERKARYNMATSNITANFRIDDPKAARDFVDAFIRHSRKAPTPPSPNFRFITTVE